MQFSAFPSTWSSTTMFVSDPAGRAVSTAYVSPVYGGGSLQNAIVLAPVTT